MMPSHLQVFDGLRITTEHIDHLQACFETSVLELRTLAGLGVVHQGFEVTVTGTGQLTVGPGLAFDAAANRVVADEPATLEPGPPPEDGSAAERYVCVRYRQVLAGEVEGVPTLVFDSAEVSLDAAVPDPAVDDGLAVARVTVGRTEAGTVVQVDDLRRPDPAVDADGEVTDLPAEEGAEDAEGALAEPTSEDDDGTGAPAPEGSQAGTPEPAPDAGPPEPGPVEVDAGTPQPGSVEAAAAAPPDGGGGSFVTLPRYDQGVVGLVTVGGPALGGWPGPVGPVAPPDLPLAIATVGLPFAATRLDVDGVVTVQVTGTAGDPVVVTGVSRGTALLDGPVRQQAVTEAAGANVISADALGRVDLDRAFAPARPELAGLGVVLTAAPDEGGATVTVGLRWQGPVDDAAIKAMEEVALGVACDGTIAWTATDS